MKPDPNLTGTVNPSPPTGTFDPALDAGLAAAFGDDLTPGGWSQPPLLRDDPSDGSPLVQPSSPEMPRGSDDRYQLLGEIARGGMGVVLKGRDPDLGRDLAFKVLRAELARRPGAVQRFVEEAQVGGQLQHPGVVPVYDLGRFADGRPYFAMKLVKGRTLADLLAERSSPSADRGLFLQHFLQVCQTIAYAHSKGVIHRDLKPSNVMVGGFGEVLVMDWGLAKVLPKGGVADELKASRAGSRPTEEGPTEIKTARFGSGGSETQAGSVMGTPAFMPPEQAGGEIEKLDERADVFGLGAVLCVILTGEPPYVADTSDAIRLMAVRAQLADAFARLDACGTDPELVSLCKRCLAPERETRPRHAGEVAGAMAAYLAAVEERAQHAELDRAAAAAEAREQRKRRRVQLALGCAVLLLVAGGGAFAWWQDKQAAIRRTESALRALEEEAEQQRRQTLTERDAVAALESLRSLIAEARKQEDDPERMKLTLVAARSHLGRAEAVLAAGNPTNDVRQLVAAGGRELAESDQDAKLLSAIEAVFTGPGHNRLDGVVFGQCETAFRESGLDIFGLPPATVTQRLRNHPHRRRLQLALAYWIANIPDDDHLPPGKDLALLGKAMVSTLGTPDSPFETTVNTFNAFNANKNPAALLALARAPETLDWSPYEIFFLAVLLGQIGGSCDQSASELWTAAAERHPDSFLLNYCLGKYLSKSELGGQDKLQWSVRFLTAAVALRPRNADALFELAKALNKLRDHTAAVRYLERVVALAPDHFPANYGLGIGYKSLNRSTEAIVCLRKATRLQPGFAAGHNTLGEALRDAGQINEAIKEFETAVRLDEKFANPHRNKALILEAHGDALAADREWREADRLFPETEFAFHTDFGAYLWRTARYSEAIVRFRKVLAAQPGNVPALNALAWLLASCPDAGVRDGREAVRLATRACELSGWKDPNVIDTLAGAHAEAGDFEKAVEQMQRALAFPSYEKVAGPGARARLDQYRRKEPYRERPVAVAPPPREGKR